MKDKGKLVFKFSYDAGGVEVHINVDAKGSLAIRFGSLVEDGDDWTYLDKSEALMLCETLRLAAKLTNEEP